MEIPAKDIQEMPPEQDIYDTPLIEPEMPKVELKVSDVPQGPGSNLDSDTVDGIQAVTATAAGPNKLVATGGNGILPQAILGLSSISANGYASLGTLKIQWGKYTGGANSPTITFPSAFTTLYSLTGSVITAVALNGTMLEIVTPTTTNFVGNQRRHDAISLTDDFFWIAVGI